MHKRWFYVVFFCVNLLLSSYYLDIWLTPNATSRALPVLTLYEDNTLQIDKYKDYTIDKSEVKGHYYSDKAPLGSFLVYPFYFIYKSLRLPELKDSTILKYPLYILDYETFNGIVCLPDARFFVLPKTSTVFIFADVLCGAIPFCIIMLLALMAAVKAASENDVELTEKTRDKQIVGLSPVVAVMMSFYGSFLFAYAGTFTGHILSGFFALTGYIFLKKRSFLFAGLMVGFATASEFTLGFLIPLWALLIYLNEKKLSKPGLFIAGITPGIAFIMYYNWHITGSPVLTPYSYLANGYAQKNIGFTQPRLEALRGVTFSTYRGMLFYAPVLLLLLWYVIRRNIKTVKGLLSGKRKALISAFIRNYLLVTVIVYTLLISAYFMWSGGWAYGPRQILPLVVICLYEGVAYIVSKKTSSLFFYIVSVIGLLFVWLDKSTKIYELPDNSTRYPNPVFDIIIPDFFQHKFNTNMLPVFLSDSNPVASIYAWPLFFIAGVIILANWNSKNHALKRRKAFISITCMIVASLFFFVSRNTRLKNNFSVNTSGIFSGWSHFNKGARYMDTAQVTNDSIRRIHYYELSSAEFKIVTGLWPGYPVGFYNLGICYDKKGYADSAIAEFKKSLHVKPDYIPAAKYAAILYFKKEQYDSAIHYYKIIHKLEPANNGAIMDLEKSYEKINRKDSASY